MSELEEFKSTVEAFLGREGLSPSRFGNEIAGDPQFVFDLRDGREPRSETRARILAAMQGFAGKSAGEAAPLRLGLAGLGNVGAALARIVSADAGVLKRQFGRDIVVAEVSARSRAKDRGIDLTACAWFDDPVELARSAGNDVFIELIGGEDGPAYASVRAALDRGKPVVTGNKALLAKHGVELARLAEANGTSIGFEAAVAGGIPVIKTLREGLGSASVRRVYGIMNGTCNYVLTRMGEEGISFAEGLKEAQALGYAEPDPSFDIEGFDTAHKLALLTCLAFGSEIDSDQIFVEGITRITQTDIRVAADLGYKIKLLGVAEQTPEGIEQRVHPSLVSKSSAIAGVDGVLNAIAIETNHVAELIMAGPGAGGEATAASVLSDILDFARGHQIAPLRIPADQLAPYRRAPMRAHSGGYFIRLAARDVPGALAAIAARMAEGGISLESVIQRPDLRLGIDSPEAEKYRTLVLITHATTESSVRAALSQIAGDGYTVGDAQLIRIETL